LLSWRTLFHSYLRSPGRVEPLQQRTLFVGWNKDALSLWKTLKRDQASAYDIVGWVQIDPEAQEALPETEFPCLGSLAEVERLIGTHAVDMVIVADLHGARDQMIALANLCEREMIQFKVIPSVFRVFSSGLALETIAGTPILGVTRLPLDHTINVMAKRALDIVGALVGLLLSGPIVALFGALVWLESKGSIFYRQRRWGYNGVPFEIIKIRSMKLNAEQGKGAQWCVKDDPRRLRVGAFMRKTNIDELPQFWNVLKGEMSLVGPRPERPELIAGFKHEIPHYNARHTAKPGMTGWAQINGLRGDTDLGERIQCDLWYLENWSLWLDIQIMALTFFKRDNAY
jgi:exopolysaccharide biosynthesis polyprenyl glycosylphosphotransferase